MMMMMIEIHGGFVDTVHLCWRADPAAVVQVGDLAWPRQQRDLCT